MARRFRASSRSTRARARSSGSTAINRSSTFFSPYIGGAQRLSNGNTLICEGCDGRIFEVTRAGEVVWEYVNPHCFVDPTRAGLNNWVFRAFRYTPEEIERARRA